MQEIFASIAFPDKRQAETLLAALPCGRPGFAERLARTLRESSDPLRALIGLQRYLECCPDRDWPLDTFAAELPFARMCTIVFAQSHFLTDILCRCPEHLRWLWETAERARPRPAEDTLRELLGPEGRFGSFEAACRAMRLFRQRAMLRIAVRDIVDYAPVEPVTEDLSNLADAMLEAALHAALPELEARYGQPGPKAGFVIFAMGKLGGRELNFSSDIDLLFIYAQEGATAGGSAGSIENERFYCKLGERVIKAMSEVTADGFVFRVDMRLRPHGRAGALSVQFDNALDYYTGYGRAWERQALIKARPCAGDIALGEAFLKRLRPFVFPKYFDDRTLDDIRETKAQTEAMIAGRGETEREVKLGRGGIRDIEFTVQMLQLLNGGRIPELRTANTLEAIEQLGLHGRLAPFEANTLARNYAFLRQIEHRLQVEDARQCHALPEPGPALDDFARRLGYTHGDALMRVYRERSRETRHILERFLASKGAGQLWVGDLLNPHSDGCDGLEKLRAMGFADAEKARGELLLLAGGPQEKPFSAHVRQQCAEIVPELLDALAATSAPDRLLVRLGQILSRLSAPATLYELLRTDPALCHFLVTLTANSEYLANLLIRDPGLLELVSGGAARTRPATRAELESELAGLRAAYDPEAAPYRLRDGEMLRVAMRELTGGGLAQVGDELSQLAEVILEDALAAGRAKTAERYGPAETPLAVLGLGKLGGWEMGYGSDLDLLFVYRDDAPLECGMGAAEYYADASARTMRLLKEPARYGLLYDIDARLRPDGGKGALAVSLERLAQYYSEEAQPWERFALMKVRAVAGGRGFAREAETLAKELAFSVPLDAATFEHNETLRRKMHERASERDLKKSPGGIADVEYLTRYLQLQHVAECPELRRGDVFGALDILAENALIEDGVFQTLREAYRDLRRILNRVRMMRGDATNTLPETPGECADLAARLGIAEDLPAYVAARRRRVYALYESTLEALRARFG